MTNFDLFSLRSEQLKSNSYDVIRRYINDFENTPSNDELAGFVKGVVKLQTEIYSVMQREYENEEISPSIQNLWNYKAIKGE